MYKFYRPRRPGGIGNGLALEGVSAKFGLVATLILLAVGLAIQYAKERITARELQAVGVCMSAEAYKGKKGNTFHIPLTQSRQLIVEGNAALALDTAALFSLQKGDSLLAFIRWQVAVSWQAGKSPRHNTPVFWLQSKQAGTWIIPMEAYKKVERNNGNVGFWIALFALILLIYQLGVRIPVPLWMALALYAVALAIVLFM